MQAQKASALNRLSFAAHPEASLALPAGERNFHVCRKDTIDLVDDIQPALPAPSGFLPITVCLIETLPANRCRLACSPKTGPANKGDSG